jgi:hypothetical protein
MITGMRDGKARALLFVPITFRPIVPTGVERSRWTWDFLSPVLICGVRRRDNGIVSKSTPLRPLLSTRQPLGSPSTRQLLDF